MRHTTGDRPTFEDRFGPLAALSYRVAYRLVGDRGEAEDLAQEALARAYGRWRSVCGYDEAWVARVTTNLAIGRWRQRRLAAERAPLALRAAHGRRGALGAGTAAGVPSHAERVDLVRALRALPRRQREVVALRYLADRPEAEVAEVLGCSVGAVKQHAHRGLAALRERLGRPDHDDDEENASVRASR
ncbi:MAG TPA: SigE family RNA polymerase sigma factor [Acidimicrobiales bacterium]|nr:SigE family RNA polymerase sigma factor [Acidimicrobiales bacterium]